MRSLSMQIDSEKDLTPEEISDAIEDKYDVFFAQMEFNIGAILRMDDEKRVDICKMLVKKSKEFKVTVLPLWEDVIDDPSNYETLAKEFNKGNIL